MKKLTLIILILLFTSLTFGQDQLPLFWSNMRHFGDNVLISKGQINVLYSAPNYYTDGVFRSSSDKGLIQDNGEAVVAVFVDGNYETISLESTNYYSAPYSMPVTGQAIILLKMVADAYGVYEYFLSIPYTGEITEGDYRVSFMYKQSSGTFSCYGIKWKAGNDLYTWSNSKVDEKTFNASADWQSGYADVSFYKDSSSIGAYPAIFSIGFEKKTGATLYIDNIKIQPINTSKKYRVRTHIVGAADKISFDEGENYIHSLGNRVLLSPDKAYYSNGDTVIVSTMKADGWTFDHYSGDWSSKQEIDTLVVHNDDIDIYARFRKARDATNRIAVITTSAPDYTAVIAAFEAGYESADGTFNAAWISRIATDQSDFNYLDSLGYTMLIRPLENPEPRGEWYPLLIIYGTSNSFVWKAMFTKYDEPEVFVSKSTNGTNAGGYNTEFLANQTTTSNAMGYIGGQILFIMDSLDVSFWTARYLLRHSSSESVWDYYNGYGTTNIDSALAIYDSDFDYDSLDPYMDYIPEQQIYITRNVIPYPSQRRSQRFFIPIQDKLLRAKQ